MAGTIRYFYMRMNSIPQGKEFLLFCHPTWLPSRDRAKPQLDHWLHTLVCYQAKHLKSLHFKSNLFLPVAMINIGMLQADRKIRYHCHWWE
jgi:hypothetical protein